MFMIFINYVFNKLMIKRMEFVHTKEVVVPVNSSV